MSASAILPGPSAMGVIKGSDSHSDTANHQKESENFTVICLTCGFPSSKDWAQRVHSRTQAPGKPFYPFLADIKSPPTGAFICLQDGTTYLCAFCHTSLEAQWKTFEKTNVAPKERHYNLNNFICSVCGIETYRKRVRAIPFQEFPFLTKERPRGSLTLGKNPLAVVCLDCSETLWAQSAEYDRWGLPVHKRHFNWMTRPPPPEGSMEATVARLPSGETQVGSAVKKTELSTNQLPRCPATEPIVVQRRNEAFNIAIVPKPVTEFRTRTSSNSQNQNHAYQTAQLLGKRVSPERPIMTKDSINFGRSPSSSHLDPHNFHLQGPGVPVVTVAPLTSHITSTTTSSALHKGSKTILSTSPSASHHSSADLLRQSQKQKQDASHHHSSILATNLSYGAFQQHWGGTGHLEHFPYHPLGIDPSATSNGSSSTESNGNGKLSWNVPPAIINPDYARYQSFLASAGNSYKSAVESYFSQPRPHPLLQASEAMSASSRKSYKGNTSKPPSHHVAQLLLSGNNHSQAAAVNSQEALRKRRAVPENTLPPKIPHLSSSRSSDFITNARVTRHLNPAKGVERNRDYICSVSAIVNESEMARPRTKDYNHIPSHQMRRQVIEDANGAMDLSLMRALKEPGQGTEILEAAIPLRYSVGAKAPQDKNTSSGFLIANLCSENFSPPVRESKTLVAAPSPHKDTEQYSTIENVDRNSVIVNLKSPSITSVSHSPQLKSPANVSSTTAEEHKHVEASSFSENRAEVFEKIIPADNRPHSQLSTSSADEPIEIVTINIPGKQLDSPKSTSEDFNLSDDKEMDYDEIEDNIENEKPSQELDSPVPSKMAESKELEPEKLLAKSLSEYKLEKAQRAAKEQKEVEAKEQFLKHLELVSPNKRNAIQLKVLLSRYNRKALPTIKLRPEEQREEEVAMSEEVEKQVLLTAFEDASLKKSLNDPRLLNFMTNLKMKQASKAEKYRREENWRVQLAERIVRLKRGRLLSGEKKPWDMMGNISKHLLDCTTGRRRRHSLPPIPERKRRHMRSLSVTLPPSPPYRNGIESSDLLATCGASTVPESPQKVAEPTKEDVISSRLGTNRENLERILSLAKRVRQPVISYPKYIPSYASSTTPVQNGKSHELDVEANSPKETSNNANTDTTCASSPIPQNENKVDNCLCKVSGDDVDAIIKRNTICWEETKAKIDKFSRAKCEYKQNPHVEELIKLRKSITSQVSEMKLMSQWLKQHI